MVFVVRFSTAQTRIEEFLQLNSGAGGTTLSLPKTANTSVTQDLEILGKNVIILVEYKKKIIVFSNYYRHYPQPKRQVGDIPDTLNCQSLLDT